MDKQNDRDRPQSRVKQSSSFFYYIATAIVILLVIAVYFYVKNDFPSPLKDQDTTVSQSSGPPTDTDNDRIGQNLTESATGDSTSDNSTAIHRKSIDASGSPPGNETSTTHQPESTTSGDIVDQDLPPSSATDDYQDLIKVINTFYAHLDQQPYIQNSGLKNSSKVHFSKLLQKLVDNPPVVIRETDDLFTLLQNTAHFFRILGKENITIFKKILDEEKDSFEQILKAYYSLTYQPEYLKKEYAVTIPPDALNKYAGFFLNTMGGRLYLFRRDSISRMVVSYYAIITIDRANIAGDGGHGIDLRPAIHSLIEEIENGGSRLKMRDEYLETLYDLQEKYY
ncbi:MAG: hypothetical protein WBB19_18220 [Desulforhopalus sp.]